MLTFSCLSGLSEVRYLHLLAHALAVCRCHLEKRFSIVEKIASNVYCCLKEDLTVCSKLLSQKNKEIEGLMD